MPIERFQIRNEFGLGKPELYTQAVKEEDPKLILDGLTVSGLVGILRQLGDLAEFAAEVFHGLQEDAMKTASRSQKLMLRVQHIEATFPALEKAALAQTSHIHFAYTAGSDWHARIHDRQHHFLDNDLPRSIMDYYEECQDPPKLHLLDKFDIGGPGSCLRRYSDPTFFRSTSAKPDKDAMKIRKDKKARKIKKKRSFAKKGEVSRGMSTLSHSRRMQLTTDAINGLDSPIASMSDLTLKSDVGNRLSSFDSKAGSSYVECIFHLSSEMQPEEQKTYNLSSPRKMQQGDDDGDCYYSEVIQESGRKSSEIETFDQIDAKPPYVIWDEKTEIVELEDRRSGTDQASASLSPKSDLIHSDHFDEVTGAVNPKSPRTSPGDDFVSRPHSHIWCEKTDVVELENGESCQEDLVTVSMRSDLDAAQREMYAIRGVDFDQLRRENTGELDVQSHDDMSKSFYNENEDDTGSERDSFEDALNTIESEYESDLDLKTKQSAEQSSVDNKEVKSVVYELPSHDACAPSSNNGSGNASSVLSKEVSPDSPKSISLKADFVPESKSEVADDSGLSGSLPRFDDTEKGDVHDGPKVQFDTGEPSPTSADEIRSSFGNLEDLTAEGVKFWTNGGLLGLAPAKPPDFGAANAVNQDSVVKIKDILQTEHWHKLNDDKCEPNIVCSTERANGREKEASPKFSVPCSISQDNVSSQKSLLKEPQGVPHPKFSESNDVNTSNKVGYTSGGGMGSICVVAPGSALPVAPTDKAAHMEAIQENSDSSSGVFVFGQKFLVNSFRKKLSLVLDENTEPVSPIETNLLEQSRGHHNNLHRNSQNGDKSHLDFENVSPIHSLPPSPPIGHMNISFHPVNRIEASKLRLKLPGGESRQENNADLFAAFQLVPERAVPLSDAGSDTDDNTFCQSSYVSDDCLSHRSDSDSEDWESSETPEGKGGDQFDAFCRLSSTESSSSSPENGGTESYRISGDGSTGSPQSKSGVEPTLPFSTNTCAAFDLPSFDTINSALNRVKNPLSDPQSPLESPFSSQPTPPPPPLPPMQWRLLKSCSDRGECEQKSESKCINNAVESMLPRSDASSRPRKTLDRDSHNNLLEEIIAVTMKRKEQQKLNSEKEDYQVAKIKEMDEKEEFLQQLRMNERQKAKSNTEAHPVAKVKEMDEKEEFLQQIRTKSFNLRPTATARPLVTTVSTTNTKVTAILEKANAIRQAVGSDDGNDDDDDGDDSWSDN